MAHTIHLTQLTAGAEVPLPSGLTLTHEWHSWAAVGGPDEMEVTARGPLVALWETLRWLHWPIAAHNSHGTPTWWGHVAEVTLVLGKGLQIGLGLDNMSNRVLVSYTYEDAAGALQQAETTWAENTTSTARYGTKELRQTKADTTLEDAEKTRDLLLSTLGVPHALPAPGGGDVAQATIRCRGYWSTLAWKYYQNLAGKEGHETSGGASQALGVGETGTAIGFRDDPKRIFNVGPGYLNGHKIVVSGSSSNNRTFEVASLTEQDAWSFTGTGVSFGPTADPAGGSDDIADSGNHFSSLNVGDVIQVEGSTSNDGVYEVKSVKSSGHIEVREAGIVDEAAGDTVTIRRATYLVPVETVTEEDAGATVTLTQIGVKLAQSFTLENNNNWTAAEVTLRVKKVGSPSDNLTVQLCADNSGAPGTVLDSGTLAGSNVATGMGWETVSLSNTDTLSYGTTYWLVVSRSGSNDATNYFVIDVDENAGYSRGLLKLWNGSAYVDRDPDADLSFVVWGKEPTSTQLYDICDDAGQFMTTVEVVDASGISTRQYRSGENLASDEADDLLKSGTSTGARLLTTYTAQGRLLIHVPGYRTTAYYLRNDGTLVSQNGEPLEEGLTPAGRYLYLVEIPGVVDDVAVLSPVFVERATYYADGRLSWEPEGAPSPWDLAEIKQG